jgi:phage shock protein A
LTESLKNTEKLLWLEKERSATLEIEHEKLNRDMDQLRQNGEAMKRELEAFRGEGGPMPSAEEYQEEVNRIRAGSNQKINELREMKNKVEWRLGEVTQLYRTFLR